MERRNRLMDIIRGVLIVLVVGHSKTDILHDICLFYNKSGSSAIIRFHPLNSSHHKVYYYHIIIEGTGCFLFL